MTVEAVTRKAGPYVCQAGVVYPFCFKVFSASDVYVVLAGDGVEALADFGTDYVVRLNANQDNEPGGVVELLCGAAGKTVTIGSCVPYTQEVVITNKGGFYPAVLNKAYDKLTILVQQLLEEVSRCVKVTISGQEKPDTLIKTLYESALTAKESAIESAASATASASSAEEAYKWANMPEDAIVPSDVHPGEHSAYHHAQKAKQSVQAGMETIAEKTQEAISSAASSASSAAASAGAAEDSAEQAYRWANTAENALVQTDTHVGYSAWHYAQKAKQNADAAASAIMPGSLVGQLFYGQIVLSAVPIESDGLCLLNGQQLQKGSRYDKFITHIAGLKEAHPGLFVTETAWWATVGEHGSCGKFVLGEDSIRLPKVSSILECTTDMGACGDLVKAGLPNITGSAWLVGASEKTDTKSTGALRTIQMSTSASFVSQSSGTLGTARPSLDASLSNPIYGASDTVQPQTLKVLAYIVVDAVDVDALNALLKTVNEKGEQGQVLVKGENGIGWENAGADRSLLNLLADGKKRIALLAGPSPTTQELSVPAMGTYDGTRRTPFLSPPGNGWITVQYTLPNDGKTSIREVSIWNNVWVGYTNFVYTYQSSYSGAMFLPVTTNTQWAFYSPYANPTAVHFCPANGG